MCVYRKVLCSFDHNTGREGSVIVYKVRCIHSGAVGNVNFVLNKMVDLYHTEDGEYNLEELLKSHIGLSESAELTRIE